VEFVFIHSHLPIAIFLLLNHLTPSSLVDQSQMEKANDEKWKFQGNKGLNTSSVSVRGVYNMLMDSINNNDNNKTLIRLCRVDPTDNPLFRTTPIAHEAVAAAAQSFDFNCYPPTVGLPDAKRFEN
jgi:hypothetical protein